VIAACDFLRMTKKIPETLETKIERLVREHLVGQGVRPIEKVPMKVTGCGLARKPETILAK
jgi:hypothetical protein